MPVGSSIDFYCSESRKRIKKDDWDQNNADGIISGYCTHGGGFSITMNPAGKYGLEGIANVQEIVSLA